MLPASGSIWATTWSAATAASRPAISIWLATLFRVTAPDADDLEEQELLLLSRAEVEAALKAGEFKVMSWATAMALALLRI